VYTSQKSLSISKSDLRVPCIHAKNIILNIKKNILLAEEIRLKIFGYQDLTIFSLDLLSDGDSVYTRENLYENLGTPVKTCLICTGTPVKTCWKFWQS